MINRSLRAALFTLVATFFGLSQMPAQTPSLTVSLVTTFTYTKTPFSLGSIGGINSNGDIAGAIISSDDLTIEGVLRYGSGRNAGKFSPPLIDPNEGEANTAATAVNDSDAVAGYYFTGDGIAHGFFDNGGAFTTYDAPITASGTTIYGLNNGGDFVGYAIASGENTGFAVIGGAFTSFTIPETLETVATGINNLDTTVGYYFASSGRRTDAAHGFMRTADGTFTYPIDYPGAVDTFVEGINDAGLMVGYWQDSQYMTHGFALQLPSTFISYDVPKSKGSDTQFIGVNNAGLVSGIFSDKNGVHHGLTAQTQTQ